MVSQGALEDAGPLCEEALRGRLALLGPEHRVTQRSLGEQKKLVAALDRARKAATAVGDGSNLNTDDELADLGQASTAAVEQFAASFAKYVGADVAKDKNSLFAGPLDYAVMARAFSP